MTVPKACLTALALLLLAIGSGVAGASDFGEACLKAQIFTQKDCTCVESKATAAETPDMVAFLTGDEVAKQGGKPDQAQMERGMAIMGKHVEACEKQK